ncbi:MAG: hypothetical protein NT002_08845 [candidate division Zixibacteria bacterium]|nr:hypothetical protein [candidate division Zixibacteria bacterium]
MQGIGHSRFALSVWAEDFIFAGTSAALLLVVCLFKDYWYLSFLALLPFFYRISKSSFRSALRVGMLFGMTYFLNAEINTLMMQPARAVFDILAGIALCSILGGAINWTGKRWGANPLFISLIWVGFQFAVGRLTGGNTLFGNIEITLPFFNTLSTLFGFIIVSLIIVMANTLLLLVVEKAFELEGKRKHIISGGEKSWGFSQYRYVPTNSVSLLPEGRAPPLFVML